MLNRWLFRYMIMVVEVRSGPPLPLVRICGTSNICRPPIMEVIIT